MRDRGKRLDGKGWAFGQKLQNKLGTYIVTEENPHECTQYGYITIEEYHKVDPSTVGQYTGLHDAKGEQLYKSDLWLYHGVIYIVSWSCDEARYYFRHPDAFAKNDDHIGLERSTHGEKIGNIHDNPDLLEATV